MAAVTRIPLSGSTDGRGIIVAATATPGTTVHTAVASATNPDEVWLWAVNSGTAPIKLTLEWGGVTAPDDLIEETISPEAGLVLVAAGLLIRNSLVIRAFAGSANLVLLHGYVNRITN